MKTYLILKPNCHELANHLWNYASIYAYGLETGARVQNPSFIEWHRYFDLKRNESLPTRIAAQLPPLHILWKLLLVLQGSYLVRFHEACVRLTLGITRYLPPTRQLPGTECRKTYFIGWHFRNPAGLEKYRVELTAAFTPKENILQKNKEILTPYNGETLIGIHLRQESYRGLKDGRFLVSPKRVRFIVEEYLREKGLSTNDVALVVVSDKSVDTAAFNGFAVHVAYGNDVSSLFLLSKCTTIIGTNSTFSNLAAWFGNVPHIVTTNEPIDWEYYGNQTNYFQNKYATFAL